ncbi:MAG TPA: DUF4878 domain-containing protein [Hanamia sp.]|jgi:hypothetical protein|nr:DUF4878 domain-containing protein [Hanamia sp.]
MKKIIVIIIAAFVVILPSCQSGSGANPKEVLNHFFEAVSKRDMNEAKKYATKDSEGMLSMMQMGMQNMNNDHADKMMEMINNMQMGDATITGDQATVPVKDKKSGETTDFILKKESGDWKVAFDMATLMDMANKKMKEHGNMNGSDSAGMNETIDSANSHLKEKMERAQKLIDSLKDAQKE